MRALALLIAVGCGRVAFDPLDPVADAPVLVAVGGDHSCAAIDGRVACWGDNLEGELGRGTIVADPLPGWVPELPLVDHVASSAESLFAIDRDGAIWSWGHGGDHALGEESVDRPVPGRSPVVDDVVQISGGTGTCARTATGTMSCWGDADAGQLAIGSTPDFTMPVASVLTKLDEISIGGDHGCVIAQGQLLCFGCDGNLQLGVESALAPDVCKTVDNSMEACSIAPIALPGIVNPRAVSAARTHTCAIFADDLVRCWGNNVDGALGDGTNTNSATPVLVLGLGPAKAIATAKYHSCALLLDGTAACWGRGTAGQLGNGAYTSSNVPVPVDVPVPLQSISGNQASYHMCAGGIDDDVWCWGDNDLGQLDGVPGSSNASPVRVALPPLD